tara:strand:+ start:4198 stop:4836 length:639 start_codon:yes stop_codon:yes gene_type:complete
MAKRKVGDYVKGKGIIKSINPNSGNIMYERNSIKKEEIKKNEPRRNYSYKTTKDSSDSEKGTGLFRRLFGIKSKDVLEHDKIKENPHHDLQTKSELIGKDIEKVQDEAFYPGKGVEIKKLEEDKARIDKRRRYASGEEGDIQFAIDGFVGDRTELRNTLAQLDADRKANKLTDWEYKNRKKSIDYKLSEVQKQINNLYGQMKNIKTKKLAEG